MTKNNKTNQRLVLNVLAVVIGMFGLAYGSVPLYDLFCRVTGFGGETRISEQAPTTVTDRTVTVQFSSNVARGLPWKFEPEQKSMKLKVGEQRLAYYWAENLSDKPVTGTSIYNVTPHKAGPYFNKVQCFCFEKQLIAPGERIRFPVSFFIDPEAVHDKNLDDVRTITLSYTFFEARDKE